MGQALYNTSLFKFVTKIKMNNVVNSVNVLCKHAVNIFRGKTLGTNPMKICNTSLLIQINCLCFHNKEKATSIFATPFSVGLSGVP